MTPKEKTSMWSRKDVSWSTAFQVMNLAKVDDKRGSSALSLVVLCPMWTERQEEVFSALGANMQLSHR